MLQESERLLLSLTLPLREDVFNSVQVLSLLKHRGILVWLCAQTAVVERVAGQGAANLEQLIPTGKAFLRLLSFSTFEQFLLLCIDDSLVFTASKTFGSLAEALPWALEEVFSSFTFAVGDLLCAFDARTKAVILALCGALVSLEDVAFGETLSAFDCFFDEHSCGAYERKHCQDNECLHPILRVYHEPDKLNRKADE
jgi:hypothetical protein